MIMSRSPEPLEIKMRRIFPGLRAAASRELGGLIDPGQSLTRLATAFAVGTLLGFFPIPIVDSLLLALLLGRATYFNRSALLAGKVLWNELFVLPLYAPATRLGLALIGGNQPELNGALGSVLGFCVGLAILALAAALVGALLFGLVLGVFHGRFHFALLGLKSQRPA